MLRTRLPCFVMPIILSVCFVTVSNAQETPANPWTQFRGAIGTGVASESPKPPTQWDLATQTAWETVIPGTGWSSPVCENDKIWLTSAVTKAATEAEIAKKLAGDPLAEIKTLAKSVSLHAVCVNTRDGSIVHDITLGDVNSPEPVNPLNSYASPTPAIANGRVVCHFGNYGTWCLDTTTGEKIWDKKYVVDYSVGPGSSPVIAGDVVIIACDGTDQQFIVGLDAKTGDEKWKTNRPAMSGDNGEFQKAYSTPLLIEVDGKQQAVIPGAQWIAAYEPNTGKELWRAQHGQGFSVTPMAIYESGLVVFSTGFTRPELVAVDPTGSGDVTTSNIVWRTRNAAPSMPSFIAQSGQIFSITDSGILHCVDAKSGEIVNRTRIGGNYSSSPLLAGGNLYFSSREGTMTVVKCTSDLETIATNKLDSSIMASPVLIGDDLLIRTEKKLIRVKVSGS